MQITVIDKKCFTDYQEQYLADPKGPLSFIWALENIATNTPIAGTRYPILCDVVT